MEGEGRSHSAGCFGYRRVKRRPRSQTLACAPRGQAQASHPSFLSTPPPYKMKRMKEIRSWLSYRWANHNRPHRRHSHKDMNAHLFFYKHTGSLRHVRGVKGQILSPYKLQTATPVSTFTQTHQNEGTMAVSEVWLVLPSIVENG